MQHEPGPSSRGHVGNVVLLADVQNQLQPWDTDKTQQELYWKVRLGERKESIFFSLFLGKRQGLAAMASSQALPQIFQISRGCPSAVVTFFLCGTFSFWGSSPSGKPLLPVAVFQ